MYKMLRYVIIWSDNILDLSEKVNRALNDTSTKLAGGVCISQTSSTIKYYQAIIIEETVNSAYAIKSPCRDKESFDLV